MIDCSSCGYSNPMGANFCSSCGAELNPVDPGEVTATYEIIQVESEVPVPELTDLPEGSKAVLIVNHGPKKGTRIALADQVLSIGRDPESDVFLDDITVSREHAKVEPTDSGYQVSDLGSMNGTYVNKNLAESVTLRDEDELQVGRFKLTYYDVAADQES